MTFECWAHALGVTSVIVNGPSAPIHWAPVLNAGSSGARSTPKETLERANGSVFRPLPMRWQRRLDSEHIEDLVLASTAEFENRVPLFARATHRYRSSAQRSFSFSSICELGSCQLGFAR